MNTTKRKFNALLNGIGNKSTTTLASNNDQVDLTNADNTDSLTKKRRINSSNSIPAQLSYCLTRPRPMVTTVHKKSASVATPTASMDPPKYAPWDRAEFLKRLKSFSNLTDWTPKPARVNEVEWAKRGWVCQKSERVRCCLCNVEILVKLNKKEVHGKEEPVYIAQNIEDALVDKYVELIVESHDGNCLWKKRGCDDSIFKLPLNNTSTTIETLRERYNELLERSQTLPYSFNMRTPEGFDLDLVLSYLPPGFFNPLPASDQACNTPAELSKVAFLMALFGWQGHKHDRLGSQLGSVSCHACYRVLGLWIFKSKEVNSAGEEVSAAVIDRLDVVKQHRDYCPWQNPASQNGQKPTKSSTSSIAGWEIVLRVLMNDHHLRTAKDVQGGKSRSSKKATEIAPVDVDDDHARSIRDEKDKERWARLRRVKSLFETKNKRRSNASKAAAS